MAKKQRNRIVAIIEGGVLQNLFTNNTDTDILVIDYDVEGCDEADMFKLARAFKLEKGEKAETDLAHVYDTTGYKDVKYVNARFSEFARLAEEKQAKLL